MDTSIVPWQSSPASGTKNWLVDDDDDEVEEEDDDDNDDDDDFLALLFATAQQSYCLHAGVRRPSVKAVFSETVNALTPNFVKRCLSTISPDHVFFFVAVFQNFYFFYFL